jgi:GC-rich sequence DNA-binding factor
LSFSSSKGGQQIIQDPSSQADQAARQRRAAEREGRRRRRLQTRTAAAAVKKQQTPHNDGISSDDELPTSDAAEMGRARQEVSSQARQVLSDVVEDFSTIEGVMERFEAWKEDNPDSYNDAFVSVCLPKIFAPLLRLQMLFWTPFAEHNDVRQQEWYKSLSTFGFRGSETEAGLGADQDRNLVSLLVEKVVLPKMTSVTAASYDPLSTTQTLRVTRLIEKFRAEYPTLAGGSKQVRELLTTVKDKIKACVDQDMYIPIGYAKQ